MPPCDFSGRIYISQSCYDFSPIYPSLQEGEGEEMSLPVGLRRGAAVDIRRDNERLAGHV